MQRAKARVRSLVFIFIFLVQKNCPTIMPKENSCS
jgi:hypothetical protein